MHGAKGHNHENRRNKENRFNKMDVRLGEMENSKNDFCSYLLHSTELIDKHIETYPDKAFQEAAISRISEGVSNLERIVKDTENQSAAGLEDGNIIDLDRRIDEHFYSFVIDAEKYLSHFRIRRLNKLLDSENISAKFREIDTYSESIRGNYDSSKSILSQLKKELENYQITKNSSRFSKLQSEHNKYQWAL